MCARAVNRAAHCTVHLHCLTSAPLHRGCRRAHSKHHILSANLVATVSVRQIAPHATQAIIYVVDSTDRDRIGISREEFHSLLSEDELAEALILVYANKQASSGLRA